MGILTARKFLHILLFSNRDVEKKQSFKIYALLFVHKYMLNPIGGFFPEGDPITAEADDEGNWEATVPELTEGDTVTVVAESEGKDPSAPFTVSVNDLTVAAPTASISGNSTDGYPVIGEASAHAIIEILNEDNEIVGKGTANHAGNFMITLNPENVTAGDILRVVAIVRVGGKDYRSQATKIVVPNDESDGITPNGNNLNENNKDENNKFLPKTGTEDYWYISILGLVLFLFGNVLWYLELKRRRKES